MAWTTTTTRANETNDNDIIVDCGVGGERREGIDDADCE